MPQFEGMTYSVLLGSCVFEIKRKINPETFGTQKRRSQIFIDTICRSKYKEDNHLASEYKEEIYNHIKMKNSLENTLPERIIIGPFTVIVDQLKQFLINKREDLSQKLLDQFARKMSSCISEVNIFN